MSTPPTVAVVRARRKSPFTGLSKRRHSSTKSGIRVGSSRSRCWISGRSPIICNAEPSRRTVVSCPAENTLAATRTTSIGSGSEPSGKVAVAKPVKHVVARLAATVLDVGGQPFVEELERRMAHGARPGAPQRLLALATSALELLAEPLVVLLGHAQQVGDHIEREGTGEVPDELTLAALDELVDLAVGMTPHEVLVLAEPLRRDQPHQQPAVSLVLRRVHGGQLVAEGKLVAVLLNEVADVVALERDGKAREGAGHRVARRERRRVGVDGHRFVVAGHHHHPVIRLELDRALPPQEVEVGVRVTDQLVPPEEIDVVELPHQLSFGWGRRRRRRPENRVLPHGE